MKISQLSLSSIIVIVTIIGILILPIILIYKNKTYQMESDNTNVKFVVDTLINCNEAVIKQGQIEIIVENPNKWQINDTLILIKK